MKTLYDIKQLLMRFGTFIYTGDRIADLGLMEAEIREIYHTQLIDTKEYQMAILVIRREISLESEKRNRGK